MCRSLLLCIFNKIENNHLIQNGQLYFKKTDLEKL